MQNLEKILPSRSSVDTSPVISPRKARAPADVHSDEVGGDLGGETFQDVIKAFEGFLEGFEVADITYDGALQAHFFRYDGVVELVLEKSDVHVVEGGEWDPVVSSDRVGELGQGCLVMLPLGVGVEVHFVGDEQDV